MFDTLKYLKPNEIQGDIPKFKETVKSVMSIVWPSIVEAFLVALVVMLDGIMVAKLIGSDANTAITIAKQPLFIQTSLITVVNICITAIISRRRGQNESEKANKAMHLGIQMAIILGILVGVIFTIFAPNIASWMSASDTTAETLSMSVSYMRVISIGFMFNAIRLNINTAQRSIGNTKVSLYTNLAANVLNIGGNFIFIPLFGINGAALATILSNCIAMLISIAFVIPKTNFLNIRLKYLFHFDKESFLVFGNLVPGAFVEQMLMRLGFILLALIVNKLGDTQTWVNGVCGDINTMMFTIADGFAIGTSAIVGRKIGEERKDLAIVFSRVSMTISVFTAIVVGIIMLFLRPQLILLYDPPSAEHLKLAINVMIIASFTVIPQNIQWVITGILRGSGDTKFTAFTSFISIVAIRPILTYILCYSVGLGLYGAWIGMLVDQTIRCTANVLRYKSRVWLNIKV